MRRTKIVATMGPATLDGAVLVELIRAGMSVARLNFSHGTRDSYQRQFELLRAASAETGQTVLARDLHAQIRAAVRGRRAHPQGW